MSLPCSLNHNTLNSVRTEKSREWEIGMKHGGITGFEVKIGRDGGISEPSTGPSVKDRHFLSSSCSCFNNIHEKNSQFSLARSSAIFSKYSAKKKKNIAKSENNTKKPIKIILIILRMDMTA